MVHGPQFEKHLSSVLITGLLHVNMSELLCDNSIKTLPYFVEYLGNIGVLVLLTSLVIIIQFSSLL
jgi:hypothetical protein